MKRFVLLTSDWHKTPFKEDKFKTQKPNWIERIIIWLMSSEKKFACVIDRMAAVIRQKEIDLVINDGDMMENPQNELGLVTREGIEAAKKIRRSFCGKNKTRMEINAGNHCLGYRLPLSTDPKGGISFASIAGFQELTGTNGEPLCQSFNHNGYRFVLFPFGLVQESVIDFDVNELKCRILDNFSRNFLGLYDHKPILLFLHDPEALADDDLYRLIRRYRSRIVHIFCGHWHAAWNFWPNWLLAKIFSKWWLYPADLLVRLLILLLTRSLRITREVKREYKRFKDVPARMRELGVAIIPAPLGMLGLGGGFLTLDLETMEIKKY